MVREYQGLVYTVCYQLVQDADTAQDLAQEAFLAAWRPGGRRTGARPAAKSSGWPASRPTRPKTTCAAGGPAR